MDNQTPQKLTADSGLLVGTQATAVKIVGDYTAEQLETAELCAELGFSTKEILLIVGTEVKNIADAIAKGRLLADYKVRKVNYEMAQAGSSPAIAKHLELLQRAKIEDQILN